jgi:hypothetical protein
MLLSSVISWDYTWYALAYLTVLSMPSRGSTAQIFEQGSSTVTSSLIQIISYLGISAVIMLCSVENVSRSKPE